MTASAHCRIVIPAREELEQARRCISSVAAAAVAATDAGLFARVELILVDDRSPRPLAALEPSFENLTVIEAGGVGPAASRNLGASLPGEHQLLLFTDSDCRVSPDWLCAAAASAARGGVVLQGIPWLYECGNHWGVQEQRLYQHMFQSGYVAEVESRMLDSRNLALTSALFESIDGFPTDLNFAGAESRQLAQKLMDRGVPLTWVPQMQVSHIDPKDLLDSARHKFNHGRGRSVLWRDPPELASLAQRYFLEPIHRGLDPNYVIPVHMAFLLGYWTASRKEVGWSLEDVIEVCRQVHPGATDCGLRICEQLRPSDRSVLLG